MKRARRTPAEGPADGAPAPPDREGGRGRNRAGRRNRGRRLAAAGSRCRRTARAGARWAARRRRMAADQFLRGACYGAGATVVSLLAVWAQTR